MRNFFLLFITIYSIIAYSCANQGTVSGGPKDTIPPLLIESDPIHKSLNYTEQKFKLTFDERITADKLKQNLIITPYIENKYEVRIKKNDIYISFENPFDSSTTYTLNFAEGITDVTEKNPPTNLTLAFSTGPIIDSVYITGTVIDMYKNKPLEKILVTLYDEFDTLNILTGKPKYFTKTNEDGDFLIENIKNGKYRVYAFEDKNNNLINNPDEEPHGFINQPIDLNQSKNKVQLRIQQLDINPLKFSRGKYTGTYYDVVYNKYISFYSIIEHDNPKQLPIPSNNSIKDNTTIRFYYDSLYTYEKDSIGIIATTQDSLSNTSTDTLYVKFRESKRKNDPFSSSISPRDKTQVNSSFNVKLTFDKPINHINYDSIRIQYDTLTYNMLSDTSYQWNQNKTELNIELELDPKFLTNYIDSLQLIHNDTSQADSTDYFIRQYLKRVDTLSFNLVIPKASFISIENDSSQLFNNQYSYKDPDNFGIVSGTVTTTNTSYTLQLVSNNNYQVIQQVVNPKKFNFFNVPPGKYTFRVLIDIDENGKWDFGNLLQSREAESIFFYTETFDVRANWEIENLLIEF